MRGMQLRWGHLAVALWTATTLLAASADARVIAGAGSSLLCPLMQAWLPLYEKETNQTLSYECTGSGTGRRRLLAGETGFAGTDSLFSGEDYAAHEDLQMLPVVAEAVAIIFNLPGVAKLMLDRHAVGMIFAGEMTHWDDLRILRWNPTLELPHERIRVHVRSGSSGTTELFTKALLSFGHWSAARGATSTWYDDAELPAPGINLTRIRGSSSMIDTVQRTPYGIGYSGLTGVVERRAMYASLVNKAGRVAFPGRAGGTENLDSLSLDPSRLVGDMVDGLGYPIAGASYLAVRKQSADACAAVTFAMWVLRGGAGLLASGNAAVLQMFGELATPIPADRVNLIMNRAMLETCGAGDGGAAYRLPVDLDNGDVSSLLRPLRTAALTYRAERARTLAVRVGVTDAAEVPPTAPAVPPPTTLPELRIIDEITAVPAGTTAFPLAIGSLVLATNIGLSGGLMSIRVDMESIRRLMRGWLTTWADRTFTDQNSFMFQNSLNISWVADVRTMAHRTVLAHLGVPEAEAVVPSKLFPSPDALAEYIAATPGAIGVVDPFVAESWGLITLIPTREGTPYTLGMDDLEARLMAIAAREGEWPWLSEATRGEVYPFYTIVSVVIPTQLPEASSGGCAAAVTSVYPFLEWLVMSEDVQDILRAQGYVSARRVVAASYNAETEVGQGWGSLWEGLHCGAVYPFEPPAVESDMTLTYIAIGVFLGLLIVGGVAGGAYNKIQRAKEQARYNEIFGAAALAAEVAEAVAVLDFREVEDRFKDIAPEKMDRTQTAMLKISKTLQEFVKYIPQHVLVSVRGVESDDSEEESGSDCSSVVSGSSRVYGARKSDPGSSGLPRTNSGRRSSRSGSVSSRHSHISHQIHRRAERAGVKGLADTTNTAPRPVGVLVLRAGIALHGPVTRLSIAQDVQTAFLAWVLPVVQREKGLIHRVAEDSVVCAWGTPPFKRISMAQKKNLIRCAVRINLAPEGRNDRDATPDERRLISAVGTVHCGFCVADAVVGALGNDVSRTFHIQGGVVEQADCLARVAQLTGASTLLPSALVEGLFGSGIVCNAFFPVVAVGPKAKGKLKTSLLVDCIEQGDGENPTEWMYEVAEAEAEAEKAAENDSPVTALLRAIDRSVNSESAEPLIQYLAGHAKTDVMRDVPMNLNCLVQWLYTVAGNLDGGAALPVLEPGACAALYCDTVRLTQPTDVPALKMRQVAADTRA